MTELSYTKLTDMALAQAIAELPGWTIENGMITKLFEFQSYASGVVFAATVGHVADVLNHHPDLFIGYRKVRVSTVTHDAGGLTPYDIELAKRVDALV